MSAFLPPETRILRTRLAARDARRAALLVRRLRAAARALTAKHRREAATALDALTAALSGSRGERRAALLSAPATRAWLNAAEEALGLLDDAPSDVLFERVARGPHLARALPAGRVDRGFRTRVRRLGAELAERVLLQLPPLLAFHTPAGLRFGPFTADLSPDGETARAAGELPLFHPVPAVLTLAPDARFELVWGGVRLMQRGSMPSWTPAMRVEGSDIVLERHVVSTPSGLRPGAPPSAALSRRLGRALSLIRRAWAPAWREVRAHTQVVVPLAEKATVSFSLPDRPGVSYINVKGKSLVDLADDLLHETAHHRLHGLEELSPLVAAPGAADDVRYWSAWRRGPRPLRGILHAAYTFTWRAELLRRLLALADGALPRDWMRRQLRFEVGALRETVDDLRDARQRGLLTPAGVTVARAIEGRVAGLPRRVT